MFFPTRIVAFHKFGCHILDSQTFAGKEYDKVIEHV